MAIKDNYIGKTFGRLYVVKKSGYKTYPSGRKHSLYLCKCSCGNEKIVDYCNLYRGNTKSCGCYSMELRKSRSGVNANNYKNGIYGKRLRAIYSSMKQRCFNPNNPTYKNYGERGITVCPEWLGEDGFSNFGKWAYENGYNPKAKRGECTLDRIDNNENYCPENCRWADSKTQSRNKRDNVLIEYNGELKTIMQWCEELNIKHSTLRNRIKRGWTPEMAITRPVREYGYALAMDKIILFERE